MSEAGRRLDGQRPRGEGGCMPSQPWSRRDLLKASTALAGVLFAELVKATAPPPGEDPLRSKLIDVRQNECFVDETRLGDLAITVAHRIESSGAGRTRIVYAVEAVGPEASQIGPAVASDFPQVLAALAKLAEGRAA